MVFRKTGHESGGAELIIECWNAPLPPGEVPEPVHTHPKQEKIFRIIDGELMVRVHGVESVLHAGDELTIGPDDAHSFWNGSDREVHYWQEFRPALPIGEFFVTLFALARDGKLDERGMPSLLQVAASGSRFRNEIMASSPPPFVQRIAFAVLAPVARVLGHHAELS